MVKLIIITTNIINKKNKSLNVFISIKIIAGGVINILIRFYNLLLFLYRQIKYFHISEK